MARIAREAGISKALLYHYFPSKQDFFVATLQQGAEEIARADRARSRPAAARRRSPAASTPSSAGSRRTSSPTAS